MINNIPQRPRKRYRTREQLLKEIEHAQAESARLYAKANQWERQGQNYLASEEPWLQEEGQRLLENVDRDRARANRLLSTRVPKLRKALAVLETIPFEFLDDTSVIVR